MPPCLNRRELLRCLVGGLAAVSLPLPVAPAASPAAISIPFGRLPSNVIVYGPAYRIAYNANTRKFTSEKIAEGYTETFDEIGSRYLD